MARLQESTWRLYTIYVVYITRVRNFERRFKKGGFDDYWHETWIFLQVYQWAQNLNLTGSVRNRVLSRARVDTVKNIAVRIFTYLSAFFLTSLQATVLLVRLILSVIPCYKPTDQPAKPFYLEQSNKEAKQGAYAAGQWQQVSIEHILAFPFSSSTVHCKPLSLSQSMMK